MDPSQGLQAANPLRVLLFSTLYPSQARPRHGLFVHTRLRELMRSHPVQAEVIAPVPWFFSRHSRWGDYARMAATSPVEWLDGVRVHHPKYPLLPKVGMTLAPLLLALWTWPTLMRLRREGFDFDAIDAHYFYPDGVAAALLARWSDRPLTITARGSDINLIAQYRLPRLMMQWAASRAGGLIGVSAALSERLRVLCARPERVHTMRNGVDLDRFEAMDPTQAREALGLKLPAGSKLLLMVGHLVHHKGQHRVIDALAQLAPSRPHLHLCLVGDGPDRAVLGQQVDRLGLQSRVRFQPAVDQCELPAWYSAADALVLASSREGWPNVVLESMACGTPVVSTSVGATPQMITSEVGRLVDGDSTEALTAAISGLLDQPPPRKRVRQHAQQFGWAETSEAQYQLIASLGRAAQERSRA